MVQLVPFEFHQPKAFDARSVHEIAAFRQGKHLGKCRRVLALLVRTRYVACFQFKARKQAVDQGALSHTAVTREQVDACRGKRCLQCIHAFPRFSGSTQGRVAGLMVDFLEVFEAIHGSCLASVQIAFVEDQGGRNPVGFSGHKESIDEARAGFWAGHRDDKKSPIQVGGNNVALFGQVDRTAHNCVAAFLPLHNQRRLILAMEFNDHPVAHGERIGRTVALQAQAPSRSARIHTSGFSFTHFIPRACGA